MPDDEPSHITIKRPPRRPPSAEDLELMAAPDDEIWRRTHAFGFDLDECKSRLTRGDQWHQLIQAHLYIDHIISTMLTDALVDPSAIGASRMAFAQKLNLIRAMGLIDADVAATIGKINNLRNKVAHDLSFSITEESERDLINIAPQRLKDVATVHLDRDKGSPARFDDILYATVWMSEVTRHVHAYMRLLEKKHALMVVSQIDTLGKQISDTMQNATAMINKLREKTGV